LPVPRDILIAIDGYSSPAHTGRLQNAIDFLVPENTPTLAAANGQVTFVKNESRMGGPSIKYWPFSNFIVIQHLHGEYSRYDHLAYKSSKVGVGQQVRAGQSIGLTGMTGFTFVPHLHFQVFVFTGNNIWTDFETLAVNDFEDN
jgi:murein DD-endopeptidase MepM/ murein hydrolase activator NlpD